MYIGWIETYFVVNRDTLYRELMNILYKRLKVDVNVVKLSICYSHAIDNVKPSMIEVIDNETLDFVITMAKNNNMNDIKLFIN